MQNCTICRRWRCIVIFEMRDEGRPSSVVRMVTYEFNIYALVWWNQYIKKVSDGRRTHIDTWLDLKRELRTRFALASYARDLYNKLQRMYQGSKSIEEYFKEMEVALMRANVLEFNEATMARFLHGKRLVSQCSNKRSMVIREDENVESESSHEDSSSSSEVESASDSFHCEGDLLMVRRLMSAQVSCQGKACSLFIDGGSSANVSSLGLVEKLNLPTFVHPRPYKL
ncbi:hypothetical protein CR513_19137, partial [Mucuna pruriens]